MRFFFLILTISWLWGCQSFAQASEKLLFGPEWTFTRADLADPNRTHLLGPLLYQYQRALVPGAHKGSTLHGKVYYDPSFTLELGLDPGVVEVQATPQNLEQWKKRAPVLQNELFDLMKTAVGLTPHEIEGAGHVNMGLAGVFDQNVKLFRNFVIDFLNNPGVSVVLGHQPSDKRDAEHFSERPSDIRNEFIQELSTIDASMDQRSEVDSFFKYHRFFEHGPLSAGDKYVALGLRGSLQKGYYGQRAGAAPDARFEIRTLRPQATMDDFIKVIEIFHARVEFLKRSPGLVSFQDPKPIRDGYLALKHYYFYLTEAGLEYERYKSLMPPAWREIPLEDFLKPAEIKKAQKFKMEAQKYKRPGLTCSKAHSF